MPVMTIGIGGGALIVGAAVGTLFGWLLRRRQKGEVGDSGGVGMDPQLARDIESAATAWTYAHGMPEAADLLAS